MTRWQIIRVLFVVAYRVIVKRDYLGLLQDLLPKEPAAVDEPTKHHPAAMGFVPELRKMVRGGGHTLLTVLVLSGVAMAAGQITVTGYPPVPVTIKGGDGISIAGGVITASSGAEFANYTTIDRVAKSELSSSTTSTATNVAANSAAVKTAYDLAAGKLSPTGNGSGLTGITAGQVGAATAAQGVLAGTALQPTGVTAGTITDTDTVAFARSGSWFSSAWSGIKTGLKSFFDGIYATKANLELNVLDYGAKGDTISALDGAVTATSSTFTSASASFTSADTGKTILIYGAGVAGAMYQGTVTYVSATTLTLFPVAGTTVTASEYKLGTDDSSVIQSIIDTYGTAYTPISTHLMAAHKRLVLTFPASKHFLIGSPVSITNKDEITITGKGLISFGEIKAFIVTGGRRIEFHRTKADGMVYNYSPATSTYVYATRNGTGTQSNQVIFTSNEVSHVKKALETSLQDPKTGYQTIATDNLLETYNVAGSVGLDLGTTDDNVFDNGVNGFETQIWQRTANANIRGNHTWANAGRGVAPLNVNYGIVISKPSYLSSRLIINGNYIGDCSISSLKLYDGALTNGTYDMPIIITNNDFFRYGSDSNRLITLEHATSLDLNNLIIAHNRGILNSSPGLDPILFVNTQQGSGNAIIEDNFWKGATNQQALPRPTVKITATDTTKGYLQDKLVAGSNISLTKNNAGANETLTVASTTGGTDGKIQYNNGGVFGGATLMTWDDINNRLGLNNAAPSYLLDIAKQSGEGGLDVALRSTDTTVATALDFFEGTTFKGSVATFGSAHTTTSWRDSLHVTAATNDLGKILFRTRTGGVYYERLYIQNNGNVGIGTTDPTEKLHVSGNALVTGNATAKTFTGTIPAATTYGATTTVDLSLGDSPKVTLTGATTLAFSNPLAGQWHKFRIKQDTTGNRAVTWPSTGLVCTWLDTSNLETTTAPAINLAANAVTEIIIHTTSATTAECYKR